MKQQFVPSTETAQSGESSAESQEQVYELCPWATEVIECDGGWQAFESVADAEIWLNQI